MKHRTALAVRASVVSLVCIGAALRIYAYLGNPSLWLDEAALAQNIIGRSFLGLLAPLDRQQVAPLGFLLLEKCAVSLFGTSEYALRLVPLLASLASLPLFAWVARRLLAPVAAIFALALFATATPLLYFAAETKQYSLDVAVALALFALVLRQRSPARAVVFDSSPAPNAATPRARIFALAAIGAIAPWLSQPSVFALGGVGLYLILPLLRANSTERRRGARALTPMFALWGASAAASILRSSTAISAADRADLDRFWEHAFMPLSRGMMASVHWLGGTTHDVFHWLFPPIVAIAAIALFVLGIVALARRRDGTATLLLAPIGLALVASALRAYPVSYRLLLFAAPSLLLASGAGAQWLLALARSLGTTHARRDAGPETQAAHPRYLASASSLVVCVILVLMAVRSAMATVELPFYREELRPLVRYLAEHREQGDAIYVYYGAARAFEYYATRDSIPPSAYQIGRCERGDWRRYLHDMDALRGRPRVWFVLSHPFTKGGIREDSLFLDYLSTLGRRLDSANAIGAELQLYDLSGPRAPGASSHAPDVLANFVPPASGDSSAAAIGCLGVVSN